MSTKTETIPYETVPLSNKKIRTIFKSSHLSNGTEVHVGLQKDHPHGGIAYLHEFFNTQPDGRRTKLVFTLTPEACRALMELYSAFGICKDRRKRKSKQEAAE